MFRPLGDLPDTGIGILSLASLALQAEFQSLDQEDPLEDETSTYSTTHDWRTPWTGEPGGLQLMGSQRVRHD